MVKTIRIIAVMLLAAVATCPADGAESHPFQVGEKLSYQIFWGPFVVGRATLEVRGIEAVDGHDCYHLVATAKTTGFADLLFPVDSRTESWLDVQGLFTRKYRQTRREGDHRRHDETTYDYERNVAITKNFIKGKNKRSRIDQPVLDPISSLYYVRTRPLLLDAEQRFVVNASQTNYVVHVSPDQRKTIWLRPVGNVPALRLEPKPTLKIVSSNKGRMWFWVSDDARHLPLLVASDLQIGSAKLVLAKIESAKPAPDNAPPSAEQPAAAPAAGEVASAAPIRSPPLTTLSADP
jgi:hypothetical protein